MQLNINLQLVTMIRDLLIIICLFAYVAPKLLNSFKRLSNFITETVERFKSKSKEPISKEDELNNYLFKFKDIIPDTIPEAINYDSYNNYYDDGAMFDGGVEIISDKYERRIEEQCNIL